MTRCTLTLRLAGPLSTAGLASAGHGIDQPFLRDHEDRMILAGTLVRGNVRHVLDAIAAAAPAHLPAEKVARWFGLASGGDEGQEAFAHPEAWAPNGGTLRFGDLVAQAGATPGTLTRIAVDQGTGSVVPGALQVVESPARPGEEVCFAGSLDADPEALPWIERALRLIPALGAHKSAGFGRLLGATLTPESTAAEAAAAAAAGSVAAFAAAGRANITLAFAAPFLVAATSWGGNSVRGGTVIPGSALKAVVASALGADDPAHPLHEALGQVVFGHLAPHRVGAERPRAIPLSAYFVGDMDDPEAALLDALTDDPVDYAWSGVVRFEPDWKSGKALNLLRARFHHTFVPRYEARTRTAITASGIAEGQKLFSQAAVIPGDHVWSGTLAQGEAAPEAFAALLSALPARLDAFGKTRVSAEAKVAACGALTAPSISGRCCLVLESEALLHAPGEEDGAAPLAEQMAAYLAHAIPARGGPQVSPDGLDVVCYARHRRVGGYLAARFRGQEDGYRPWLLTAAGSVIAFDAPPEAGPAIASFLTRGLPLPRALASRTWRDCPFVPANGYGAVRLGTGLGGTA